jgi:hypothetical protein
MVGRRGAAAAGVGIAATGAVAANCGTSKGGRDLGGFRGDVTGPGRFSSAGEVPRPTPLLDARSQTPGDNALRMNRQTKMQRNGQVGS